MLAVRKRWCAAAARASSKRFYQWRHEQKQQVVVEAGARVPCSSAWRFPSLPHTTPSPPFSRPMLLLTMRGAKRRAMPSTAPPTTKPKEPGQQAKKQHPDVKATSDLFMRWEIPWDGKRVVITMTAFGVSVLFVGFTIGFVIVWFGLDQRPLKPDETAILLFTGLLLQTVAGISLIKACIKSYSPLPKELFSYDWRNPFSARRGWLLWGVVGTFCAVAAVQLIVNVTTKEQFSMGYDPLLLFQPLIGASKTSTALLLTGSGILAPILEETLFRGFLLTSLTKWVPAHVAVFVSAGAFALVHFTPAKLPEMFALGVVLGFSYLKTRNLLTPIMIHGVWNSGVILLLTFLHGRGYDIGKLIESGKLIRKPVVQTPDCAGKE